MSLHIWMHMREHYSEMCCSCGWQCAFKNSLTHYAYRCQEAHNRHVERETVQPEPEQAEDSEAGFLDECGKALDEFESGEDFDERFSDERGHAL
jgi:hypothetical protein